MKLLHLLYPPVCPINTKLAIALLTVLLLPIGMIAYHGSFKSHEHLLKVGMTTSVIACVMALLLTQILTNSIDVLTKAAQMLEQENFLISQALLRMARMQNRIGRSARVFISMIEAVQSRENQLKRQVTELGLEIEGMRKDEILLKELSNSDIDWLLTEGKQMEMSSGDVIQNEDTIDIFYIALTGTFQLDLGSNSVSKSLRLSSGDVIGCIPFVDIQPISGVITVLEKSSVVAISQQQLTHKLQRDTRFAARFYRWIALLLSRRLHHLSKQLDEHQFVQVQPLRDTLFILGELHDSDIDWLIGVGERQRIPANTVLIRESGPVDALYIPLEGALIASRAESDVNPLSQIFRISQCREVATAKPTIGGMIGETLLLDSCLPASTIKTLEDSVVLTIARHKLMLKIQQDVGFSSRFYRVMVILIFNRLQAIFAPVGKDEDIDRRYHRKINQHKNEILLSALGQMSMAGTRLNWMLERLDKI